MPGAFMTYYSDKIECLRSIFGTQAIEHEPNALRVDGRSYPIVDDVIILLEPAQYPDSLKKRLKAHQSAPSGTADFAGDIQFTFGEEWQKYPQIMPEHQSEFALYFDIVDIDSLKNARVCDLGCGIGRWSYFLKERCRELILIDFSEAIFVARRNLKDFNRALFFMGDLKRLPFKDNFADFLFCLGVLHHLPSPALEEARNLRRFAPRLLIYLYYSLDNRPFFHRVALGLVTGVRRCVSKVRSRFFRAFFVECAAIFIYCPLVWLGKIFQLFGRGRLIPLYDGYNGKSLKRIRQDVYDRFFTRIEQRFSRNEIMALKDSFESVLVSPNIPYWHFLCTSHKGR